jgi:aryl-alcohol dehydrogenase-like predicted oxidoreductase
MSSINTQFGNTGLTVSRLGLGTMTFGLQTDEAVSREILAKAADAGINLIDTADVYPVGGDLSTVGRTEEIVGRWLEGQRHRFILATKAVGVMGPAPWDRGASRKHLVDAVHASLRRLRTDYIDLYQLHGDDRTTPLEETIDTLDDLVRAGLVRYVGCSNFLAYRLARALGKSESRQRVKFVSVQPRYNLLHREIERELLPLAAEEKLAVVPYNPLAGGFLTGKHRQQDGPTPGGRFTLGTVAERYQQRYWHDRAFASVEALGRLADEAGVPLTTLAVAWVLANPTITAPLIGASRPQQLDDVLAATTFTLDPALKTRLDELTAEYRRGDSDR